MYVSVVDTQSATGQNRREN